MVSPGRASCCDGHLFWILLGSYLQAVQRQGMEEKYLIHSFALSFDRFQHLLHSQHHHYGTKDLWRCAIPDSSGGMGDQVLTVGVFC